MDDNSTSVYAQFMQMVKRENFVILDTETTGLDRGSEIIQIAVIDHDGLPLLNTYVHPVRGIPADATRIHGIDLNKVNGAPRWIELVPYLKKELSGKDIITYNATFDRKMFHFSDELSMLPHIEWKEIGAWYCAMEMYAEWYGEYNSYYQSYRWQPLTEACKFLRLEVNDAHTALGDALMTYELIRRLRAINVENRAALVKSASDRQS